MCVPRQEMLKVSSDSSLQKHSDKQQVRAQSSWSPTGHYHFADGETEAQREVDFPRSPARVLQVGSGVRDSTRVTKPRDFFSFCRVLGGDCRWG